MSLEVEGIRTQMHTEGRSREDTGKRRWPLARLGERSQKEPIPVAL